MINVKNILHYPTLQTVLMVEKIIYDTSGTYSKKQLWVKLPKRVMYQTYSIIIDYLLYSRKIAVDKEGKICWIWDPEGVKNWLKRGDLLWKPNRK